MEPLSVMSGVMQLGKALVTLKGMYDQHRENKEEIKRLEGCIRDLEERIPKLTPRLEEIGISSRSVDDSKKLETVIKAIKTLEGWAADKSFFVVLKSADRMQKMEQLQAEVMASMLTNFAFVQMSINGHIISAILAGHEKIFEWLEEPRPHRARPLQASSSMSNILKPIKHTMLFEDHQLVATEYGVVYPTCIDPSTASTKEWMYRGQNDFVSCNYGEPFRRTSPPFTSGTGKLYLGVKMLSVGRPAMLV